MSEKRVEEGPFIVAKGSDGKWHMASDCFEHDVWFRVSGDFASPEERKSYIEQLCKIINDGIAKNPIVTKV